MIDEKKIFDIKQKIKQAKESNNQKSLINLQKKLCKLDPSRENLYEQVITLYNNLRFKDALIVLTEIIENYSADLQSLITLGNIYIKLSKKEEALLTYQRAKSLEPTNPLPRYCIGVTYSEMDNFSEAEKSLKSALEFDDKDYLIWLELARLHFRQSNYGRTVHYSRKTLELKKDHPETMIIMAVAFYKQKKLKSALSIQENVSKIIPKDSDVLKFLARLYYETNQEEKAKEVLKRAKQVSK